MKYYFFLIFLFSILGGCSSIEDSTLNSILIININVIDPLDGLTENQYVLVGNGKINKIYNKEPRLSNPVKTIDGTGKYLIPGLWDTHVHFDYDDLLSIKLFDLFLWYGITSVRDTGGELKKVVSWKRKSDGDPENTPRMLIAGPLLDGNPNVYDGSAPNYPDLSIRLDSVEDIEPKIKILIDNNVDFLKAYEMLAPDQFEEICRLGKVHNLKVSGHVPLSMRAENASDVGLNSLEHLRNLELDCASNSDVLHEQRKDLLEKGKDDQGGVLRNRIHKAQKLIALEHFDSIKAKQIFKKFAVNKTWQVPTVCLNTAFYERPFEKQEWQESFSFFPDAVELEWKARIKEFSEIATPQVEKKFSEWTYLVIPMMKREGIKFMAGTDSPIFFLTPGLSLHYELEKFVMAGFSPLEALATATIRPAEYFNLQDSLGRISEGMIADLLLLDENPLDDITNTKKISGLFKNGKYHSKESLKAMLLKK